MCIILVKRQPLKAITSTKKQCGCLPGGAPGNCAGKGCTQGICRTHMHAASSDAGSTITASKLSAGVHSPWRLFTLARGIRRLNCGLLAGAWSLQPAGCAVGGGGEGSGGGGGGTRTASAGRPEPRRTFPVSALLLPAAPAIRASRPPPTCARTCRGSILMCRRGAGAAVSWAESCQYGFAPLRRGPMAPRTGWAAPSAPDTARCISLVMAALPVMSAVDSPRHRLGRLDGSGLCWCLWAGRDGPKHRRC